MYRVIDMRLSNSGACELHEISNHKKFNAALNKALYHFRDGRQVLLICGEKFNGGSYVVFRKEDAERAYDFYREIGVRFVEVWSFLPAGESIGRYTVSHSSYEFNSETGHYLEFGDNPVMYDDEEETSYVIGRISRRFDS